MLPQENHTFCCTLPKSNQGSVSAGLTLASDFSFCFQCQAGSGLLLRRPIEITRVTGGVARKSYFRPTLSETTAIEPQWVSFSAPNPCSIDVTL